MNEDDEITLIPIDADLYPASDACLRHMAAHGYDPDMPVFRSVVTSMFMLQAKARRPDVANFVQLLVRPFGIVDPRPASPLFRVAELQVGDIVLDVEAEYEYEAQHGE